MPGRQAHGTPLLSKQSRSRKNNHKKRTLNAYAIAAESQPEQLKIRRHRLGDYEGGSKSTKRPREGSEDEESNFSEVKSKKQKSQRLKGDFDDLEDVGSDSEGHTWRIGEVNSDDDSDLDSDEAFGESDEEKFEGFVFSGSGGSKKSAVKKEQRRPARKNPLDEEEEEDHQDDSEDDSLGEEAVDLATMLDASEEHSEDEAKEPRYHDGNEDSDAGSEDESEASDIESSVSSMDESDDDDPHKLAALQSLIANLPQSERLAAASTKSHIERSSEFNTPSDFGIAPKTKLTLEDLGLPAVGDPHVKKSLKLLEKEERREKSKDGKSQKLSVPLARRQQDRLDRKAAYEKSKETLERWTDTVKHNRRAEHLIFPLPDQDLASMHNNNKLQPTNSAKPFNELEATIQSILEESGLAPTDGNDAEDKIREFEELEVKKLSIEEVRARRAELRRARDLLFREEVRAKRIKKIKSRSYRRVHRKQQEKEERMSKEALAAAGVDLSDDDKEARDRQRALERISGKHKASRWAKSVKDIGRAAWDVDARDGVSEMARRDEELRKRIEGTTLKRDGVEGSASESESEAESESDDEAENRRLLGKLGKLDGSDADAGAGYGSKLADLKFMRNAEAARKKANDELVEEIRRELNGEEHQPEEELQEELGRRVFGPGIKEDVKPREKSILHNDFEEREDSEDDQGDALPITKEHEISSTRRTATFNEGSKIKDLTGGQRRSRPQKSILSNSELNSVDSSHETGAWTKILSGTSPETRRKGKTASSANAEVLDLTDVTVLTKLSKTPKKLKRKDSAPLDLPSEDEANSDEDDTNDLPFAIRDQDLIKRAFAGADVVGDFEAEKRQIIEDEDDKIVDETLPGWGSWVGDGISKKEKTKHKGRFLTKVEGIKAENRKDAKLERVIINEKRVKKNAKYLAPALPHPYESRQQYERTLRMPIGPEWGTKETFQNATKPRILLKQGIIPPMSKPLI